MCWVHCKFLMHPPVQVHVEAQLKLPPCTWVDREVELSPLERHIYEEQSSRLMRSLEGLGGIENTLAIGSADLPPTTKQVNLNSNFV